LKHVMDALKRMEAQEMVPVLRMEIDYELVTLHDAILDGDRDKMEKTKERLEELRQELNRLMN
jgi:hypothetical protein